MSWFLPGRDLFRGVSAMVQARRGMPSWCVSSPSNTNALVPADSAHLAGRWRIAALLSFGVLIAYVDRVNLSVSYASLVQTFGISATTFGLLSAAYSWTYAACQLPAGLVLDRFGVRRVGMVSIVLWTLASIGSAITPTLAGFFGARFLLGIGEASTFPGNAKAIGQWFPKSERSMATSLFDSAAKLASAIGVPVLGLVLLRVGWRWSFALTGAISLVYLLLFLTFYRDPRPEEFAGTISEEPKVRSASLGYLALNRKVIGLSIGFGAYNYVFYLLLTWLPQYLTSALGVDLLHSFLYTGVPWLFATCTDLFIGGWLVDSLIRRGHDQSKVRRIVLVCGTACGLGILGAAHTHSPAVALAWISLSIGGLSAAAPVAWSVPALIAPPRSDGRVGGIMNFVTQFSAIGAPIITGYFVERRHSFSGPFLVAASYLVLGILGYGLLMGRIEQIEPEHGTAV